MKKVTMSVFFVAFCLFDLIYLAMTADSFYQEYVLDKFVYWGYPQWGWMYADPKVYLWFNVFYLLFLVVLPVAAVWLWRRRFRKTSLILSVLPLLSAAVFAYMPNYNWNRQFEIFEAERTIENSRIPAGRWWASAEQMQRYDDNSAWEKFKGYFGRGEWPGGYPIWGIIGYGCCRILPRIRWDGAEWFFTAETKQVRRGELIWGMTLLILQSGCVATGDR